MSRKRKDPSAPTEGYEVKRITSLNKNDSNTSGTRALVSLCKAILFQHRQLHMTAFQHALVLPWLGLVYANGELRESNRGFHS